MDCYRFDCVKTDSYLALWVLTGDSVMFSHFAPQKSAYNIRMADKKAEDEDKFDAVLRRMLDMKPMTAKELSAKLKAEKAAKTVQILDK